MYCPNCEVFICDSCNLSHSSSVFTQNHKRQQQSSYSAGGGSNSFETIKKKHCSEHSSEFVFGYCFGCSVFVCGCCILGSHSEHKEMIFSLAESAKKRRDQVAKIGDDLRRRMQVIEKIQQENVDEIKSLKEKLMKKEKEQKELELEIGDLKMRHDTIGRLSNMPTDDSILNENIFSTLLQTANDLVDEMIQKKETFEEREDTRELQVSFPWEGSPWGVSVNSGGNILVAERMKNVTLRNRENGSLIRTFDSLNRSFGLFDDPIDVSCGTEDQVVVLDTAKCQVVIFNKEGHYVRSFGSCGSRYGEFKGPCSVVVDKENQIIVADSGNHRIQVFGSDGRFIRCFGRVGSLEGQFFSPTGVAIDRDGHLVISDLGNHRIQVMGIEGNFLFAFGSYGPKDSELSFPQSVSVDGKGRIVVCDSGNERMCVFEKDGTFLFSFGDGKLNSPRCVASDRYGYIISDCSLEGEKTVQLWL